MWNFILGCCCGLVVGVIGATVALSGAQTAPGNFYAPGSFMSDTNLQNAIISADTDAYLNSQRGLYSSPLPYSVNPCPR